MYRRCRETCSSLLPFGQTGCFLNRLLTCIPGLWLLLFLPLINSMSWKCLETLEFCSRTCLVPSRSLRTVCPLEWTGGLGAECRILQGPSRVGRESPSLARVHGGGEPSVQVVLAPLTHSSILPPPLFLRPRPPEKDQWAQRSWQREGAACPGIPSRHRDVFLPW